MAATLFHDSWFPALENNRKWRPIVRSLRGLCNSFTCSGWSLSLNWLVFPLTTPLAIKFCQSMIKGQRFCLNFWCSTSLGTSMLGVFLNSKKKTVQKFPFYFFSLCLPLMFFLQWRRMSHAKEKGKRQTKLSVKKTETKTKNRGAVKTSFELHR